MLVGDVDQATQYLACRSKVGHPFTAAHSALVSLTQRTTAIEPSKRTFYNLAFRQNLKATLLARATHNIKHNGEASVYPINQHPGITLSHLHPPQAWQAAIRAVEQFFCAIAIGQGGATDDYHNQQTKCIDQEMPFTAFDLLARIIAMALTFLKHLLKVWPEKLPICLPIPISPNYLGDKG